MLRRRREKTEHLVDSDKLEQVIHALSKELKMDTAEIKTHVNNFIVQEVSEWLGKNVELVDDKFNLKVIDEDKIIAIDSIPLVVLRKIRFYFKKIINDKRNDNISTLLNNNIGKLISGCVARTTDRNVFVNVDDHCFKVPLKNFLQTDIIEEGSKYLFCVVQNEESGDIFLTRTTQVFFEQLFKLYIPEIEENLMTIIKIYRIPGEKIHVFFSSSVDNFISHCIGGQSDKLQHIIDELSGEKINFIDISYNFYKSLATVLRIDKYYTQIIVDKKGGVCNIYCDQLKIYRFLQKQSKSVHILESVFNVQINLTYNVTEEDNLSMLKDIMRIESESELKTINSALSNIRKLYNVCSSILCVKYLIDRDVVKNMFKVLIRLFEDDSNYDNVAEDLMKQDVSVYEYKNK